MEGHLFISLKIPQRNRVIIVTQIYFTPPKGLIDNVIDQYIELTRVFAFFQKRVHVWVILKRHQQNILDQIYVGQCCSSHEIPLNEFGPRREGGTARNCTLVVFVVQHSPGIAFFGSKSRNPTDHESL